MSSKAPKNVNWGRIYEELDNYYADYLTLDNLLALGFEHNESSGSLHSSKGSPLLYEGRFYLFHEVGRSSGLPVLFRIDGPGNNVGFSPAKYMTEFEKWDVKELMVKGLSEHTKIHELGWQMPKVAKLNNSNKSEYESFSNIDSYKGTSIIVTLRDYLEDNYEKGQYYDRLFKKLNEHLHPLVFNELKTAFPKPVLNRRAKKMDFFDRDDKLKFTYSFVMQDKGLCVLDHSNNSSIDSVSYFNMFSSVASLNDKERYDYLLKSALGEDIFDKHFKNAEHEYLMAKRKQEVEERKLMVKKAEQEKRRAAVIESRKSWNKCELNNDGGILQERGITLEILNDYRLKDTFAYGQESIGFGKNARVVDFVGFKHPLRNGSVYTYERFCRKDDTGKNVKLMRPGGKLFWITNNLYDADVVVITEKPLDAMSHMALYKDKDYAYISSSGRPGAEMLVYVGKLISDVNSKRDNPVMLVMAFDNDEDKAVNAGAVMSNLYMDVFKDTYVNVKESKMDEGKGIMFPILPILGVNDWNDALVRVGEINANMVKESQRLEQPSIVSGADAGNPNNLVDADHANDIEVSKEILSAAAAKQASIIDEAAPDESRQVSQNTPRS